MGYDQNNAGIHLVVRPDNVDGANFAGDYSEMIMEAGLPQDTKYLTDVENSNNCLIASEKGIVSKCPCGGILDFRDRIPVKYHRVEKMRTVLRTVYMTGKQCRECGKKLLVRDILLAAIKEDLSKGDSK